MKSPLPLNVRFHWQIIRLTVGTMAKSLHAWVKDAFRNQILYLGILKKTVNVIDQKEALHNFLWIEKVSLWDCYCNSFGPLNLNLRSWIFAVAKIIYSYHQSKCNIFSFKSNQFYLKHNNQLKTWYIKI